MKNTEHPEGSKTSGTLWRSIPRTKGSVVITDPVLLASLRLSPEAEERIERLEAVTRRGPSGILLGWTSPRRRQSDVA
jgi:hypothetical protein